MNVSHGWRRLPFPSISCRCGSVGLFVISNHWLHIKCEVIRQLTTRVLVIQPLVAKSIETVPIQIQLHKRPGDTCIIPYVFGVYYRKRNTFNACLATIMNHCVKQVDPYDCHWLGYAMKIKHIYIQHKVPCNRSSNIILMNICPRELHRIEAMNICRIQMILIKQY